MLSAASCCCFRRCPATLVLILVHVLCSRPAVALIRKLIAVLESIERLPLHLYDTPGSLYNLQVSPSLVLALLWQEVGVGSLCVCLLRRKLSMCTCALLRS